MAYTSSVTAFYPRAERIGANMGMQIGSLDITEYNSTQTAETDITKHFISSADVEVAVIFLISDLGYTFRWIGSTSKVEVLKSPMCANGPMDEAGNGVDVGAATFIAVGLRSA